MFFILPHQVPAGHKITYANLVCTIQPGKTEPLRAWMTVGGDCLDTFQDMRLPAVGVTDTKLHFDSVISDAKHGVRYCTANLKDFFLGSNMNVFQYMQLHCKYVTTKIFAGNNLAKVHFNLRSFCSVKIRKGMYGLQEATILAYKQLCDHLAQCRYSPVPNTPGLWRHSTCRTTFTLTVNDSGIKFFSQADANHLLNTIATKYAMTTDWPGTSYLGFTINLNYKDRWVNVSMPGYVPKAMLTLKHPNPSKRQHTPHSWTDPVYGQKVEFSGNNQMPLLDKQDIKRLQKISGLFLYYSQSCNPTILVALNKISNTQALPTERTRQACDMLLDYLATHPNAIIQYHASDMILAVCSNAAYLVLPNARSRATGHFFLTDLPGATSNHPNLKPNGAVHVLCKTLLGVSALAAKAETASPFLNAQEAVPLVTTLKELGHPQPK